VVALVALTGALAAVASGAGVFLRGDLATQIFRTVRGEDAEILTGGIYRFNGEAGPAEGVGGGLVTMFIVLPASLLALLKSIERRFGRRPGKRWGPRVLDLDILAWDGPPMRSRSLIIPHPALTTRRFMLAPLATIRQQFETADVEGGSTEGGSAPGERAAKRRRA